VFAVVGGLIGFLVAPVLAVVAGAVVLLVLLAGAVALLIPLVPLALVILVGWAFYRILRPAPYPIA
jgi:hypothetical protein